MARPGGRRVRSRCRPEGNTWGTTRTNCSGLAGQLGMLGTDQAAQLRDELAQGRLAGSGDELRQRLGLPAAVFEALLSIGGQGDSLSPSEERSLLTQIGLPPKT